MCSGCWPAFVKHQIGFWQGECKVVREKWANWVNEMKGATPERKEELRAGLNRSKEAWLEERQQTKTASLKASENKQWEEEENEEK